MADGLNTSILFMQGVVFLVIPAFIGLAIWHSYHSHRRGLAAGAGFQPAGKIRWDSATEAQAVIANGDSEQPSA